METSDVIDTESADGDIMKILLGSFVEEYDNLEHIMSPAWTETPSDPFQRDMDTQETHYTRQIPLR